MEFLRLLILKKKENLHAGKSLDSTVVQRQLCNRLREVPQLVAVSDNAFKYFQFVDGIN